MLTSLMLALAVVGSAESPRTPPHAPSKGPLLVPASGGASDFGAQRTAAPFTLDPAHAYVSPDSPSPVQTLDLSLEDGARRKDLELRVRAPKVLAPAPNATSIITSDPTSATPEVVMGEVDPDRRSPDGLSLPLIIFSHGAGGSLNAFPELSAHLASLGYVVVHPTHSDSIELRTRRGEDLSRLRENPSRLVADVDAPDRLADVSFIIDSIPAIQDALNKDRDSSAWIAIDPERVGMAGHSAGAYTTQVAIGAKVRGLRWGGGFRARTEPRIKAGVLISGQGTTNRSLRDDSWSEITTPMLVIAGSLDVSRISNETPESRREPFEKARAGDKYLVYIEGATHGSYQGKTLATMLRENPTTDVGVITAAVSSATTAFFDFYLSESVEARSYLESDAIVKLTSGAAEYKRK